MSALQAALELHKSGKLGEAEASYRQIVDSDPTNADAIYLLGVLANDRADHAQAAELIGRAATLRPDVLHFQLDLGIVLTQLNQLDRAIATLRSVIAIQPDSGPAFGQLGLALHRHGDLVAALAAMRLSLEFEANAPAVLLNLGALLHDLGRYDDAASACRQAILLVPNYGNAHFNLGAALQQQGKLDEAMAAYEASLRITPNRIDALNNIAAIFKDQGRVDEAIALYRRIVELAPGDPLCHSNLAYTIHFDPACDARAIHDEARRWNARHAEALKSEIRPQTRASNASKRVRVGYVSPDFREHAVGRFMLPLLENHDRDAFELFCYSDIRRDEPITEQSRAAVDRWRDSARLNDAELADLIRADEIDILIDLTMHMDRNRLPVFARHPAPVQATYLAYCSTTGLDVIDFRISDPHLDPVGMDESIYSEKTVRLAETYWCYRAPPSAPAIGAAPMAKTRNVTFGCLNNFCKVTPAVLSVWGRLLQRVPGAQLVLSAHEGSHRARVWEQFRSMGVVPQRVRFVPPVSLAEYLKVYETIDVALDPFPYNGGTTTCDALWMGVPVVTLAGATGMSRAGLSILTSAGLSEFVASSEEQYVDLAAKLAGDIDRVVELRSTLRDRLSKSVLTDEVRFARNFESLLRQMLEAKTS